MAINVPDPRRPRPRKFATAFQLDLARGHFFFFINRMGKALMWELARKAHGHCHSEFFGKERAEELNHFDESCKFQKLNQFPFLGTQAEQPGSKRKKLGRKDGTIDWVSVQSIVSVYTLYPSLVFLCVFIPILFQESSYNVGGGHDLTNEPTVPGAYSAPCVSL